MFSGAGSFESHQKETEFWSSISTGLSTPRKLQSKNLKRQDSQNLKFNFSLFTPMKKVVYCGLSQKWGVKFSEIREDWTLWADFLYDPSVGKGKYVGAIYELDIDEKWTVKWHNKAINCGYWKNETDLLEWNAKNRAITDSEATVKTLKKKEEDYCKVLRDCYHSLPYPARAAFIARVVKLIVE